MNLERATLAAHRRAFAYEPALIKAAAALLRKERKHGAARLKEVGHTATLGVRELFPTAPSQSEFDRVHQILHDAAVAAAGPILEAAPVTAAVQPSADEQALAISFTIKNPLVRHLLAEFGTSITQVTERERAEIVAAARQAYADGLSIKDAAASILSETSVETEMRATRIARTMLIGASNGASLAAVRMTGGALFKTWLATADARTRADHADADGQTVPVDAAFQVGGYPMQYPGDPSGPADEVISCRCTCTYSDTGDAGLSLAASGGRLPAMSVSGSSTLPLSARDAAWDSGAAQKRLSPAQYPDAHFWRDPEGDPATLAAYKLPFADIIDGKLTAVWKGVTGAAGAIQGARGGVKLPDSDVAGVKTRIGGYYRKAASKYGDDTIQPPWSSSAAMLPPNHTYAGDGGPCVMCGMPMDAPAHDMPVVAALDGVAWHAILALEGTPTADGRIFDVGAFIWRDPPLTLYAQFENAEGHDDAPIAGRIDTITRVIQGDTAIISGTGIFDSGDAGQTAARLVGDRTLNGVSIDFAIHEAEIIDGPIGPDGQPGSGTLRIASATVLAATLLGMPAFDEAHIAITADAGHATLLVPLHVTITRRDSVTADIAAAAAALDRATLPERITAAAGLLDRHVITEDEARQMIGLDGDAPDVPLPAPSQDVLSVLTASLDERFKPLAAALERVASQPPQPIMITMPEPRPTRVIRDPETREIIGSEPVEATA